MPHFEVTRISFVFTVFEEPKPLKRAQDPRLHRIGKRVQWLAQHTIDGNRAQTRQALTRLPVVRGNRQGPEGDAGIALRPSVTQASIKISQVEMPQRDMEQDGRKGLPGW